MFPFSWKGHYIKLIENECFVTTTGRLKFRFFLNCTNCGKEEIVRGKLRHKYSDYDNCAAILKLRALASFDSEC